MKTLFTSYKCDQSEPIIQMIIKRWKLLNPDFNIMIWFLMFQKPFLFQNQIPYMLSHS